MSKFKQFEGRLESKGYSEDSATKIAASVGRKKYGAKVMSKAAHAGVSAEAMKRRMHKSMGGK